MNKKAYFFSIAVLIIVSGIFLTTILSTSTLMEKDSIVQEERIKQLQSLVSAFEKDSSIALQITSSRALVELTNQVASASITDDAELQERFSELVIDGTFEGIPAEIMENSTLINWTSNVETIFDALGANMTLTVGDISIYQEAPSSLTVRMIASYIVKDDRQGIVWDKKDQIILTKIDIEGFKDPLYTKYTNGLYENKIELVAKPRNKNELLLHAQNQVYVASNKAPGFLQRFLDAVNQEDYEHGIQSLINTPNKERAGLSTTNTSIVDWQYFITKPTTYCSDENLLDWIKINNTENYPISC